VGTFAPAVSLSISYDRTAAPLTAWWWGVPRVTTYSSATSMNHMQLFPEGPSFTLTVNGIAQMSTEQSLLFDTVVVGRPKCRGPPYQKHRQRDR
jgi:hypothetical protein